MEKEEKIRKYIKEKIRQARIECSLTQEDAGVLIGRTQSFISRCETGERRIDIIDLVNFGRIYKKSIQYFLPENIFIDSIKN
jgi:DNA-binding XRE family transcriptional regulator